MTRNLEPASRRACGFFNCDEFSRHIPVHLCAPFRTALFQPDVEGLSPYSLLAIHTPDLIRLSGMPNLCGHVGDQVADFFFKILLGDSFVPCCRSNIVPQVAGLPSHRSLACQPAGLSHFRRPTLPKIRPHVCSCSSHMLRTAVRTNAGLGAGTRT